MVSRLSPGLGAGFCQLALPLPARATWFCGGVFVAAEYALRCCGRAFGGLVGTPTAEAALVESASRFYVAVP